MVCDHWLKYTVELANIKTGETITLVKYVENTMGYHKALHKLEYFISKLVTAGFRKSWVLNPLLNHSRFTPYYWRLKAKIFRASEVIYER